jgi:hypothetical protein
MPFPTNTDTNATAAADRLVQVARQVRDGAVKYVSQCVAQSVNAHDLISAFCVNLLVPASAAWSQLRVVAGVQAALRAKYPGRWADDAAVTADLTDAQTEIDSTISYVVANTPVDGSGWVLTLKVVSNQFQQRVVTAGAQLNPLQARLEALRDAFSA